MIIVFLGPPASGKGTQSARLKKQFGFYHFDTGAVLREEVEAATPLGERIDSFISRGELVPVDIIKVVISKFLSQPQAERIMFDGFPRNFQQATVLNAGLREIGKQLDHAIYLNVHRDELMRRVVNRRVSESSGAIYNIATNPPLTPGICDIDGSPLIQRKDDTEEVFARRLEIYFSETVPVLEYYRERGLLREIDGNHGIDSITAEIARLLGLNENAAA